MDRLTRTTLARLDADTQPCAEFILNDDGNTLDGLHQLAVESRTATTPPASPADGSSYIVGAEALGAWNLYDGSIAIYFSGWIFMAPWEGVRIFVKDEGKWLIYNGSNWRTYATAVPADLTDSSGGTASTFLSPISPLTVLGGTGTTDTTLEAVPDPADSPAFADALRDDLVANVLPPLDRNIRDLSAQMNAQGVLNTSVANALSSIAAGEKAIRDGLRQRGLLTGSVLYLKARQCSNNSLVDLWKLASSIPSLPAVYSQGGEDYYFTSTSPASSSPGTLMSGEVYVGTSCSTFMRATLCDGGTYVDLWKVIDGVSLPAVYSYGGVYYKFDTGQTTTQDPTGLTVMDGSETYYGATCPPIYRQAKYCGNASDTWYTATLGSVRWEGSPTNQSNWANSTGLVFFNGGSPLPAGTYHLIYDSGALKWNVTAAPLASPYSGYGVHAWVEDDTTSNTNNYTGKWSVGVHLVTESNVLRGAAPGAGGTNAPVFTTEAELVEQVGGEDFVITTAVSGIIGLQLQVDNSELANEPTAWTLDDNDSGTNPTFKLGTSTHYPGQPSDQWVDESKGVPYYFLSGGIRYYVDASSPRAVATPPFGSIVTGETVESGCP